MTGKSVQSSYIAVKKSSDKKPINESYQPSRGRIFGMLHVVCGLVVFGTGIGLIVNDKRYRQVWVGTGIWSSVVFFISGGLSIGSVNNTNYCLVMNIFSGISGGILVIFSGLGWGIDKCYGIYDYCDDTVLVAMNVLWLIAGVTEMVLAIISSSISCKATCCRGKMDTSTPPWMMCTPTCGMDHVQLVSHDMLAA